MKELKTKCSTCKGKLYQGKFWIYGFNARKYCSKNCMFIKELDRARKCIEAYSKSPQLRQVWQEEYNKLDKQFVKYTAF